MTDGRRLGGLNDTDTPPWLQPVPVEEEEPEGPSPGRLIAGVLLGIVLIGALVGGFFWFMNRDDHGGRVQLIKAEPGPYKIPAPDPGGMEIEGKGDTAFAASEGAKPLGRINVNAVPEAPLTAGGGDAARAEPGAIGTIQLGAFSSEASANKAWKALSERFAYLAPLGHSIIPVEQEEKTLYRLRANGPDAVSICNRLRIAGEACVTVE